MQDVKNIFYICTYILRFQINLFGYSVSIMQVIVFVFIAAILFRILRDIF